MTMAAVTNTSLEKRICAASNFIGLIPLISFNSPPSLLKLPNIYPTKIANAMNFVYKRDFVVKLARLT